MFDFINLIIKNQDSKIFNLFILIYTILNKYHVLSNLKMRD